MRAWVMTLALLGCGAAKEELENSKRELARLQVDRVANEWYPLWAVKSADAQCPKSIGDLTTAAAGRADDANDPWGNAIEFECNTGGGIRAFSRGPDGKPGTADDISSK
jgi:hypothetical protein